MAGVLTVLPIYITWAVVKFVFGMMWEATHPLALWVTTVSAENPNSPIPAFLRARLSWLEPVIAVLLTLFFLYLLGFCTAHLFGRRILEGIERLVDRVPIAKTVYRLTKQIVTTMAGQTEMSRGRVVLVEVYRPGIKCVGFLTSVLTDQGTGREFCTVFIPSTPNPAVGYTHIVAREQVVETDWTMEKAVKIVVSGGVAAPSEIVWGAGPGASGTS